MVDIDKFKEFIPEPYFSILKNGGNVDYNDKTHRVNDYVEKLGYNTHMNSDCSYTADGLHGMTLVSYGDWGTIYASWADENAYTIFTDLIKLGIINLWRGGLYVDSNHYVYQNGEWSTYSKEFKSWIPAEQPF